MMSTDTALRADHPETAAAPLLTIEGLRIGFPSLEGIVLAANDVHLTVGQGEVLGLVGESGSGKSVTCRAIVGMVPHPGAVLGGRIDYDGRNVLEFNRAEMRELRAREIAMIFQDPASALNPVFTIGHQISEVLRVNAGLGRAAARARSIELLERVGIPAPDRRMSAYPHEMSGGMRQRVMIAMALAGEPRLLLADEPTTALDVTIQDQVLQLLEDLRHERNMSMILVSHDMGVIGTAADRVAVMYAGRIVEVAPTDVLFSSPDHPYTRALIDAMPQLEPEDRSELRTIPGQPPDLLKLPEGCPFAPRCPLARDECAEVSMELTAVSLAQFSACPFARDRS
ncbi:MAG: ABC transporter ATP-binding protein [bacterium]|nr:ABC transporter ATP-binding protein [bacterium]